MREIKNTYFKDFGNHATYMSGRSIPVESDGVCRDIRFVNCDFHAGCSVPYQRCEFVDCSGTPNYNQREQ